MRGTIDTEIDPWIRDSLVAVDTTGYRRRHDGSYLYRGERPAGGWHAHGTTPRVLRCLVGGRLVQVRLHKQRWKHVESGSTCHSRPADDVPRVRSCSLVVVLLLWSWLWSDVGLWRQRPALPALGSAATPRTLQRWMRRALADARRTAQALRATLIERIEPRPVESLPPRGRGPPEEHFRRWSDPAAASTLSRALTIAVFGAKELSLPTARLLAVARRRWPAPEDRFLL